MAVSSSMTRIRNAIQFPRSCMSPANCMGSEPRYPRQMQFETVLRTFGDFFEREQIPWAIAGGLAVAAWGYQRATHDIDFVVSGSEQLRVVAFAESLGYETTYASEGFSNHIHPVDDFGHVDLLYLYGRTAAELFEAATKRVVVGGVSAAG